MTYFATWTEIMGVFTSISGFEQWICAGTKRPECRAVLSINEFTLLDIRKIIDPGYVEPYAVITFRPCRCTNMTDLEQLSLSIRADCIHCSVPSLYSDGKFLSCTIGWSNRPQFPCNPTGKKIVSQLQRKFKKIVRFPMVRTREGITTTHVGYTIGALELYKIGIRLTHMNVEYVPIQDDL